MKKDSIRDALTPQPNPGRWISFRVSEYTLFQKNIRIPNTPDRVDSCPGWMRTGFKMYRRLQDLGFRDFPEDNHQQQVLEVYPHAAYTVLLKKVPFLKKTLEGRLQRQLILHSLSVDIPDPMRIFEEFTRYKILQGQLPLEGLLSVEELEALIAAYTAWKAAIEPDEITRVGEPKEGEIILPSAELKPKYF
jgi:predicted RNase H-like nuclease